MLAVRKRRKPQWRRASEPAGARAAEAPRTRTRRAASRGGLEAAGNSSSSAPLSRNLYEVGTGSKGSLSQPASAGSQRRPANAARLVLASSSSRSAKFRRTRPTALRRTLPDKSPAGSSSEERKRAGDRCDRSSAPPNLSLRCPTATSRASWCLERSCCLPRRKGALNERQVRRVADKVKLSTQRDLSLRVHHVQPLQGTCPRPATRVDRVGTSSRRKERARVRNLGARRGAIRAPRRCRTSGLVPRAVGGRGCSP